MDASIRGIGNDGTLPAAHVRRVEPNKDRDGEREFEQELEPRSHEETGRASDVRHEDTADETALETGSAGPPANDEIGSRLDVTG
jgi:hypothetical protein